MPAANKTVISNEKVVNNSTELDVIFENLS